MNNTKIVEDEIPITLARSYEYTVVRTVVVKTDVLKSRIKNFTSRFPNVGQYYNVHHVGYCVCRFRKI